VSQEPSYCLASKFTLKVAVVLKSFLALAKDISVLPCKPLHWGAHNRAAGLPQIEPAREVLSTNYKTAFFLKASQNTKFIYLAFIVILSPSILSNLKLLFSLFLTDIN
jgi:hypothetical protein